MSAFSKAGDGIFNGPPWAYAINVKLGFDWDWTSLAERAHFVLETNQILDTLMHK